MNEILPWHVVPAWTAARLSFIGSLAQQVRAGTLTSLTQPGDDSWSIGCVFLNRWRAAVIDASDTIPWLTIVDRSWHFVFAVDGEPIRLWRAKAEDAPLPDRVLNRKQAELLAKKRQVQLWLPLDGIEPKPDDAQWFWRLRMVTNKAEEIVALVLEQCTEDGDTRYSWHIPLDGGMGIDVLAPAPTGPVVPAVTPLAREPVDVPPLDFEDLMPADEITTVAANTNSSDDSR